MFIHYVAMVTGHISLGRGEPPPAVNTMPSCVGGQEEVEVVTSTSNKYSSAGTHPPTVTPLVMDRLR